jgi:hypothetical protein
VAGRAGQEGDDLRDVLRRASRRAHRRIPGATHPGVATRWPACAGLGGWRCGPSGTGRLPEVRASQDQALGRRAAHRPRRRVPGLRRDEVATPAGASVDYWIELERGRGTHPSSQLLTALARAFRLDADERDPLVHLAGQPVPQARGPSVHVEPAMLTLLDTMPALVMTDLASASPVD